MYAQIKASAALAVLLLLLSPAVTMAATKVPAPGDNLPDVLLDAPTVAGTLAYLGLPKDTKKLRVSQIKAKVVVVEIFNMY